MKKKRSQLLKDLVSSNPDLESILSRLSIILSDLPEDNKNLQINEWINNELSGYPDHSLLPDYRLIKGTPKGTFIVNSFTKYSQALVPIRLSKIPKKHIEEMEILKINHSIREIQSIIKENKLIGVPIPTEILYAASTFDLQLLSVTFQVQGNQLMEIESILKEKLRKIILELEKQFTNIDELDISDEIAESPKESEKTMQTIYNILVADQSIKIGDKNKITKSKLGQFGE